MKPFSSATSSATTTRAPTPKPAPALSSHLSSFTLLAELPIELQCYILSFLPAKTLCRGIGRASTYWAGLVDAHIRRALLHLVLEDEREHDPDAGENSSDEPKNRLMFEAQRPIDTVTQKHKLWFSHFGVTNSTGGAYTTTAYFTFMPADGIAASLSPISPFAPADPNAPLNSYAMLRGIPEHLLSRVRPEYYTSSVLPTSPTALESMGGTRSARRTSMSRQGGGSTGPRTSRRPRADSAQGFTFAQARSTLATEREAESSSSSTALDTSHEEEEDIQRPLDAYDWAGPVSSSLAPPRSRSRSTSSHTSTVTTSSAGNSTDQRRRARLKAGRSQNVPKMKPTYRMQLDPLDSFETWILTLTVRSSATSPASTASEKSETHFPLQEGDYQSFATMTGGVAFGYGGGRTRNPWSSSLSGPAAAIGPADGHLRREMRWEKRIAEGLDRVYRDWFRSPEASTLGKGTANVLETHGVTPEVLSTFGAVNLALPAGDAHPPRPPPPRSLEFDNGSCQLHLQPHALGAGAGGKHGLKVDTSGTSNSSNNDDGRLGPRVPGAEEDTVTSETSATATSTSQPTPLHPALQNAYSHTYLSQPTSNLSWTYPAQSLDTLSLFPLGTHQGFSSFNASQRVELVWHAEAVEICAGRLLSVLEELEDEKRGWYAEKRSGGGSSSSGAVIGRRIVLASASTSGSSAARDWAIPGARIV